MLFRRREPKQPQSNWFTWVLVVFLVYAVISNQNKSGPVHQTVEQSSEELAPSKLFDVQGYQKVFAFGDVPRFKDNVKGAGAPVICGQQVKVAYEAFLEDGTAIDDKKSKDDPLTFHVSGDDAIPGLTQGVLGMQLGGKRSILAPSHMAYDVEAYKRDDVPAGATVRFEMELLDVSPKLPDIDTSPYRILTIAAGSGPNIVCNQKVTVYVTLWSLDGKMLYASKEKGPITFTTGKSEVAIGLEQGIIGMSGNGVRTLVIPPTFQNTMNGNKPAVSLPFPKNQTVLVDVAYVP